MKTFFKRLSDWRQRPSYAYAVAIIVSLLTIALLCGFIYLKAGGKTWAAMMPGSMYPVPSYVQSQSEMVPVHDAGWDGQFYLYQAYDPFMRHVDEINLSFDESAYRYQRNFVPFLTWLLHWFLPFADMATVFYIVQLSIIIAASLYVARFLQKNRFSPWFLLPMQLNAGLIASLRHGQPDASGDFIFYASIAALLEKRYRLAIPLLIALCLTREQYTVFVAGLVLIAAFGKLSPAGVRPFSWKALQSAALFALPGICFVAWYAIVLFVLGHSPSSQGAPLISYPFIGFIDGVKRMIIDQKVDWEIISAFYYFELLLVLIVLAVRGASKRFALTVAVLCLLLLASCLSWRVWNTWLYHTKNLSYLVGLLPLLLVMTKNRALQYYALAFSFMAVVFMLPVVQPWFPRGNILDVQGKADIDLTHFTFIEKPRLLEPALAQFGYDPSRGFPKTIVVTDYRAEASLVNAPKRVWAGNKRFGMPVNVTVQFKNTGTQPWSPFLTATEPPTWVSVKWVSEKNGKVLLHINKALNGYVYPGETIETHFSLTPPVYQGKTTVIISPAYGPVVGFETQDPKAAVSIPIELY